MFVSISNKADQNKTTNDMITKVQRIQASIDAKELGFCPSWISGKHSDNIEINTSLPYVSIGSFFAQEHEAEPIINEINLLYHLDGRRTPLSACKKWASMYGIDLD